MGGTVKYKGTYQSWQDMKQRCHNPRNHNYRHYGARGISVCERWLTFKNFLSDMGERPIGYTIERVDYDGNYEPNNCCWITKIEQRKNQRNNNQNKSKTHCLRGHPLSGDNLMRNKHGERACRACQKMRDRNAHLNQKAALKDEKAGK